MPILGPSGFGRGGGGGGSSTAAYAEYPISNNINIPNELAGTGATLTYGTVRQKFNDDNIELTTASDGWTLPAGNYEFHIAPVLSDVHTGTGYDAATSRSNLTIELLDGDGNILTSRVSVGYFRNISDLTKQSSFAYMRTNLTSSTTVKIVVKISEEGDGASSTRQKTVDGGTVIVGQLSGNITATDGDDGVSGSYERTIFRSGATAPAAPASPNSVASAGTAPTLPTGWAATPSLGTDPIWASFQRILPGSTAVSYTSPRRWDGEDGVGASITDASLDVATPANESTTEGASRQAIAEAIAAVDVPTDSEIDARVAAGVADWAETGDTTQIPASKLANAPAGSGGGLSQSQVDARVAAGVADWAETGNTDDIPASKLANAPAGSGGVSETRVRAIVEEELPPFNTVLIEPRGIAGSDYPETLDVTFNERLTDKTISSVTASLGGDPLALSTDTPITNIASRTEGFLRFDLSETVRTNLKGNQRTKRSVELDAVITYSDSTTYTYNLVFLVANDSFAATSGSGGLSQSQVDARVAAGVADWAEDGNGDDIPASKLDPGP